MAKRILILAVLFLFVLPRPADAYLDPSNGSYVLQMLVATFFGGAFLIKTWWRQISGFGQKMISKLRKDKETLEKTTIKKK